MNATESNSVSLWSDYVGVCVFFFGSNMHYKKKNVSRQFSFIHVNEENICKYIKCLFDDIDSVFE